MKIKALFFLAWSTLFIPTAWSQQIYYVDSAAVGNNNGSSWANAYTDLQAAFSASDSLDQIWVAKGTYYPTNDTTRNTSFLLKGGVSYYGGFAGHETQLSQRNWSLNETILSGDIGVPNDSSDNSYHIMFCDGSNGEAIIDGFIFEHGQATLYNPPNIINSGGAMYINELDGAVRNCIFRYNYASGAGGAVRVNYSNLLFENCLFYNNASSAGGAVHTNLHGYFKDCDFYDNTSAGSGGAIAASSNTFYNCIIKNNRSNSAGGGAWTANCTFYFCTIDSNQSGLRGGGVYASNVSSFYDCSVSFNVLNDTLSTGGGYYQEGTTYSPPSVISNTKFIGNRSTFYGGGMYSAFAPFKITNSIFAGNVAPTEGGAIWVSEGLGHTTISNSNFIGNVADSGSVIRDHNTRYDGTFFDNCIIWANQGVLRHISRSTLDVIMRNCILQDTINNPLNQNNLFTDPLLTDIDGADNILGNLDDNYIPTSISPAIDGGTTDTTGLYLLLTDITRQNQRISGGRIDIGVYEQANCSPSAIASNAGNDSTVCWGRFASTWALLNAVYPAQGVGEWVIISSTGYIEDVYAANTKVQRMSSGENIFAWKVNNCGTITWDTVTLTVYENLNLKPVVTSSGPLDICPGDSVTLYGPPGYLEYQWGGLYNTQDVVVTNQLSMTLRVSNGGGCYSLNSDPIRVDHLTVGPKPTISINGNTTFCEGSSAILNTPNNSVVDSFIWNNGTIGRTNTVTDTGAYYLYTISDDGCISPTSDTVHINHYPSANKPTLAYSDTLFCDGDTVWVGVNGTYPQYHWNNGRTTSNIPIYTDQQVYVSITDSNGCESPHSDTVHFTKVSVPQPVINSVGNTTFCQGDSVQVTGPQGYLSYQWSNGSTDQNVWIKTSGSVNLIVVDSNLCESIPSSSITTNALSLPTTPTIRPSGNINICQGSTLVLSASPAINQITWLPSGSGPTLTVGSAGSYSAFASNSFGCRSAVSAPVNINVDTVPNKPIISVNGDIAFCFDDSTTMLGPTGYSAYSWSNGGTDQQIHVNSTGNYTLRVSNSFGCESAASDPIAITVHDQPLPPELSASDTSVCSGETITIYSNALQDVEWSTGRVSNILVTDTSGQFSAILTDEHGCVSNSSPTITVTVRNVPDKPTINVANDNRSLYTGTDAEQYFWYDSIGNFATTDSSSVQLETAGTYYLVISENGCLSDASEPLTIKCLSNEVTENELKLYPNPVKDQLMVDLALLSDNDEANVYLYNYLGQQMLNDNIQVPACGLQTFNINVAQQPAGVYILKVVSGDQKLEKRFVKH